LFYVFHVQVILFGLFWLVWAECAMLLHVFDYSSVFAMPALPALYAVLSPVLVAVALVCYFYPTWVLSGWHACFSICRGLDRASSCKEQEPLLQAKRVLHEETFTETTVTAD